MHIVANYCSRNYLGYGDLFYYYFGKFTIFPLPNNITNTQPTNTKVRVGLHGKSRIQTAPTTLSHNTVFQSHIWLLLIDSVQICDVPVHKYFLGTCASFTVNGSDLSTFS